MSLQKLLEDQIEWSMKTFGPAYRTEGILRHIEKELQEIRENPDDLSEYIDVIILAMDAFWRRGGMPDELEEAIARKQEINRGRTYNVAAEDEPSEHVMEEEESHSCYDCRYNDSGDRECIGCLSLPYKPTPTHWEKE